jgi:fucose permease
MTIPFQTEHRLGDAMALQLFILRTHLVRRALLLAGLLLAGVAVTTLMNGAPLSDSLNDLARNAGLYLVLVFVGLAMICAMALLLSLLAWRRLPRPRRIIASITPDGITMQKDGFSYGARWADAGLVTETPAAYLMKFRQLYMRLPKRGFGSGDETQFRAVVAAAVPNGAGRLRN